MDVHIRIRRWVVWWVYVGVALGVVAVANLIGRDLTRRQERIILLMGVIHWVLGGLVCYACDSIRVTRPIPPPPEKLAPQDARARDSSKEWHPASDFLLPGGRKSVLPPPY